MGSTANLEELLRLPTALPVVKAKVSKLYLIAKDPQPIAGWPSPMVMIPTTMAKDLKWTPKAEDFAWNENHPLLLALKANPQAQINSAPMLAVLNAVRGKDFPLPLTPDKAAAADKVFAELIPQKPAPRQLFRRPQV